MREILFRGKEFRTPHDEYDSGWITGFYCSKSGAHFITYTEEPDNGGRYFSDILVEPETVGQFTGLFDKNGKKIFEGDVLSVIRGNVMAGKMYPKRTELGIVEYHKDRFLMKIEYEYKDITPLKYIEVVGNIHDNPELKAVTIDE